MIAFGQPFIEILIESGMTLNQYFILYCHVYDKEDLIQSQILCNDSVEGYHKLISLGYIKDFKSKEPTRRGIKFIKELENGKRDFKDGTADGLLHGQMREENRTSEYKQGYDFGLSLWQDSYDTRN